MEYISTEQLYNIYKEHPLIVKDTRDVVKGCIFLAIKGENFDANEFAEKAIGLGASYAIIDNDKKQKDYRFLLVDNSLAALQDLARFHRMHLTIPLIGITGSNGKTTSKELIYSVLSEKYNTYATKGNYNNHIGVPLSVLEIKDTHEIAIIEMGASAQKEIEFLCSICDPNCGMITNIGKAHLEGFGGIEGVKKGKSELYRHIEKKEGLIFINGDDEILNKLVHTSRLKTYGLGNGLDCTGKLEKTHPSISGFWETNKQSGKISSTLYGEYNFYNMLAAVCIANHFGLTSMQIDSGINAYKSSNNRSELIDYKGSKIYLDAYNANPSSMEYAVQNFSKNKGDRKIVILGDMFEVGNNSSIEHKKLIDFTLVKNFSDRIFVGSLFFEHQSEFPNQKFYKTTEEAKAWFKIQEFNEVEILIKGSRGMQLESLIQ